MAGGFIVMLLAFPTGELILDDTITIQSVDKDEFNLMLNEKLDKGWVISEVSSKFRKTFFGGITSYKAELKRGT